MQLPQVGSVGTESHFDVKDLVEITRFRPKYRQGPIRPTGSREQKNRALRRMERKKREKQENIHHPDEGYSSPITTVKNPVLSVRPGL